MKKLFCFIGMACALCACSDTGSEGGLEKPKDADFYEIKPIADKETVYKAYTWGGTQLVGAGYDATAAYLSLDAIKAPVIDLEKVPDECFSRGKVYTSEPVNYAGKDARAFLSDMAYATDLDDIPLQGSQPIPLFSGTLLDHQAFSSDYHHSSQYSFAYCEQVFTEERWWIGPLLEEKYDFLSRQFLDDVAHATPGEIIEKYGTHVLTDIGLGYRFRGIYRTSVPTAASDRETVRITLVGALIKMGREGLPLGSAAGGMEEDVARNMGGQLVVEFNGGDPSLLSSRPSKEEITAWRRSLKEENYALTKIINQAIPVYEFIEDEAKRRQTKEAVREYLAAREIGVVGTVPLLQAWDGENHTYHTSYSDCIKDTRRTYEGPVCSLFRQGGNRRVPLYLYGNGRNHFLSLQDTAEPGDGWQLQGVVGYAYAEPVEGAVPLYEAKGTDDYCYTLEDKKNYGEKGSWKQERIVCYVFPL